MEVRRSTRGPQIIVSRTHPGLVKRLFELEVPEIASGAVEVKSIAREAGSRTKIAVHATEENVDPVGACVGPRGGRVGAVVDELHGEKMDIVVWSEDPEQFVASLKSGMTIGIAGWGPRRKPMALIRAILARAATLGIDAIGEGVESAYQHQTLRELGCVYGQGYLFGHPQPVSSPGRGDDTLH